jgi:hypothetical protein
MTRCRTRAAQASRWLSARSLATFTALATLACSATLTLSTSTLLLIADGAQAAAASGYPPRKLSPQSLRGELLVVATPEALLNGQAVRLAPGARIHGQDNMLVMSGRAAGEKLTVNYTADTYGLVMEVWILRPEEIAQRWPKTLEEASSWLFEPQTQTWTKP